MGKYFSWSWGTESLQTVNTAYLVTVRVKDLVAFLRLTSLQAPPHEACTHAQIDIYLKHAVALLIKILTSELQLS